MTEQANYTLWGFTSRKDRQDAEAREGEADQMLYAVSKIDVSAPAGADRTDPIDYSEQDARAIASALARSRSWSFICVDNSGGTTAFTI